MKKYPEHEDIMQKLLKLLYKDGGEDHVLHASKTYGPLAKQFKLSPEQIKEPKNDKRWEPYWSNKVQSARDTLVKGGYIAPRRDGFHGYWKLTPRGIKKAQDPTHLGHRAGPKNKQTGTHTKPVVSPPLEPGQDAIDDLRSDTESMTLFTWGYWGWGTATDKLIQAVDAVETRRGYAPPMFVDIRISRSVRAPGFNGGAFEKAVGTSRYRWLGALGNVGVQDGGGMRIKDPAAANTLLDMAEVCSRTRQRILFFCSCEFPGPKGHGCHRVAVARLAVKAAGIRRLPVQIVEWPGGEPRIEKPEVHLSATAFEKMHRGATSIPLEKPVQLAEMAAVPWFSPVAVFEKGNEEQRPFVFLTGPARYKKGEWYLPIYQPSAIQKRQRRMVSPYLDKDVDEDMSDEQIHRHVQELRESGRFVLRHTQLKA